MATYQLKGRPQRSRCWAYYFVVLTGLQSGLLAQSKRQTEPSGPEYADDAVEATAFLITPCGRINSSATRTKCYRAYGKKNPNHAVAARVTEVNMPRGV